MKAFKIKNGLQASRYLLSSTTISGSTIDLSLGSMFSTTLSSDPAYTFTNPPSSGVAQAFSLEVAGGNTNYVQDSFATNIYSGTGSAQTITTGLDLATDGGLVWIKWRSSALGSSNHALYDTERGVNKILYSDTTAAEATAADSLTAFNSNGFTLGADSAYGRVNYNGTNQVAWTFKKQAKFFDIVTYTGTGSAQNISHNLGAVPAVMMVKSLSSGSRWNVYHKDASPTGNPQNGRMALNTTDAWAEAPGVSVFANLWNQTAPTDSVFTVGSYNDTNASGENFVAYLFAHDTASDSRIQCGSYTGNGANTGILQDLGWIPQWIMVKVSSSTDGWILLDSVRGVTGGNDPRLEANTNAGEASGTIMEFSSTGFTPLTTDGKINGSGKTYIYMAIRGDAATDSAITWPTSIKWPAGVAPTTPVPGKKDLFTFLTTDGGTTYYGKKAAEGIA